MAILSRKTLFSLALGGLVSSTTAWSQDAVAPAVPAASDAPAAADAVTESIPDRPGVVQVSDCPPAEFSDQKGNRDGGSRFQCREHVPAHSGWNPPGRRPIHRTWVPYHTFFPGSWTGTAGPQHRAPMVYMPTDTTQLGYYYQHVPTWHAYSGMIPPVPRPSDWHYTYHQPTAARPLGAGSQPTVAPEAPEPSLPTETTPAVPSDTSLDRSASIPAQTPIPR